MKQGRRKLQLDRITVRPLSPGQLAQAQGGTGFSFGESCGCDDPESGRCQGSMTANMTVKNCADG